MIRQGDVLVVPTTTIPADATPVARDQGRVILAYGEVTGHAHALTEPDAQLWETPDGRRYLKVEAEAKLHHEEHSTLPIAPGVHEVIIQREYDDANEWRRVVD